MEHVHFALQTRHPDEEDLLHASLPAELRLALDWERNCGADEINAFRLAAFRDLEHRAARHDHDFCPRPGHVCHPVAQRLNLLLFRSLYAELEYSALDPTLLDDLVGFPLVGQLPHSGPDTKPKSKPTWSPTTVGQLRQEREERNMRIISKMCASEWDDDLMRLTLEDAIEGFCSVPQLLTHEVVKSKTLARRFPVKGRSAQRVEDPTY